MKEITLTQGFKTKVDDEDVMQLLLHNWCILKTNHTFYARRRQGKQTVFMQYQILKINNTNLWIDHINHDGLDNQKHNLRLATVQQNNCNRSNYILNRYKGIYFDKRRNKYYSHIKFNSRKIFLGYFSSEIAAAQTYDSAAKQYFGKFACLNFPPVKPVQ